MCTKRGRRGGGRGRRGRGRCPAHPWPERRLGMVQTSAHGCDPLWKVLDSEGDPKLWTERLGHDEAVDVAVSEGAVDEVTLFMVGTPKVKVH